MAVEFRKWVTKTLHAYIVDGYTINKKRLIKNYDSFMQAVEEVKKLLPADRTINSESTIELVKLFASTWFSLDAYDKDSFSIKGTTKKQINITADSLKEALFDFKKELISKKEASDLFGVERTKDSIPGIIGSIFQSFNGSELYPTIEQKAAYLLYFIIKNHPFIDGNKRSGAFSFVWFLRKAGILDRARITPEALTALALLIAVSDSKDKDRIIGIVLMLLKK